MPDKAVCEELWSIIGDAPDGLLYRETRGEAAVWRLESSLPRGRETRPLRDKNKNTHPRAARKQQPRGSADRARRDSQYGQRFTHQMALHQARSDIQANATMTVNMI